MSTRTLVMLGWATAGATAAMALAAILLIAMAPEQPIFAGWAFRGYDVILALAIGGLGALIVSRRPRHLVGWLLLAAGITSGLQALADQYAVFAYARGIDSPAASLAAWIPQWIWITSILAVSLAVVLFPDGRLPSRRWRPFVGLLVAGMLATAGLWAIAPVASAEPNVYPVRDLFGVANSDLSSIAESLILIAPIGFLGGFLALTIRMRRADVVERQQIKWLMLAALLVGVVLAIMLIGSLLRIDPVILKILEVSGVAAFMLLPAALAIAILRHRLYDIDVLINRTLVYGGLSALLVATYVVAVVLGQALLRQLTGGSELAVAGSTLVTLALVQPLRRRLQNAVDRRFYRARYDAARTLDRLAARLRDEVEIDHLRSDVLDAVHETMHPAHAGLWLRERRR
jgi:hypothetical protein